VLHTVVANSVRNKQVRNISERKREATGQTWPALKPSTVANRRRGKIRLAGVLQVGGGLLGIFKRGRGQRNIRMLEDSGRLRGSIGVRHKSHAGWLVSTNVPYASFHQHGTSRIPKREFFYLTNQDEQDMVDYYASEAAARNTNYITWRNRQFLPDAGALGFTGFGGFGVEF